MGKHSLEERRADPWGAPERGSVDFRPELTGPEGLTVELRVIPDAVPAPSPHGDCPSYFVPAARTRPVFGEGRSACSGLARRPDGAFMYARPVSVPPRRGPLSAAQVLATLLFLLCATLSAVVGGELSGWFG